MNYRNADKCHRCPQRNDEQGCPSWWEFVETNHATGEERITKGCGKALVLPLMIEVIKASNRPAAAIESTRNEIVRGFEGLAAVLPALVAIGPVVVPQAAVDVTAELAALPEGTRP